MLSNQYSADLPALLDVYTDRLSLPLCSYNNMINIVMNINLASLTQFKYIHLNAADLNSKRWRIYGCPLLYLNINNH